MSVDPVFQFPENSQSLNPYSYVLNNPLSLTDPSGLTACSETSHEGGHGTCTYKQGDKTYTAKYDTKKDGSVAVRTNQPGRSLVIGAPSRSSAGNGATQGIGTQARGASPTATATGGQAQRPTVAPTITLPTGETMPIVDLPLVPGMSFIPLADAVLDAGEKARKLAAGGSVSAEDVAEAASSVFMKKVRALAAVADKAGQTAKEMASELRKKLGRNSVEYSTASKKGHIDLEGEDHYDKLTGARIPTPHVQEKPIHIGPSGKMNLGKETIRPATKADIRNAERLTKDED